MTIYTCPECGADLFASVICTYPPIDCMNCPSCGWHWESGPKLIERVPFGGNIGEGKEAVDGETQ